MSKEREIYRAYKEGIHRASLIRKDLEEHPTEYYPEKVRGLLKAYFSTIKEVINQGEKYLDITTNFEVGLEVGMAIENYRALIIKLKK
jgi:hypothetical protein